MKYVRELCRVIDKEQLNSGTFSFTVSCENAVRNMKAGQFANILVEGKTLRRPISVCEFSRERATVRFVIEIRGEGTKIICQKNSGDFLDILAPLGNGFDVDPNEKAVFVGGGIGVPPLLGASSDYGSNAVALLGFRSKSAVILADDFSGRGIKTLVATDDGSFGHHGLVTELLAEQLDGAKFDAVYACGPKPMLMATAAEAERRGVRCMVSLEERMGCGVGACLVCVCKTIGEGGAEKYSHVCKDGPVFDSREVVWN